jgi:acyl dehydratase
VLTTHVKVEKKYQQGSEDRVDLECSVTNEAGEAKLTGVAVAVLPRRG